MNLIFSLIIAILVPNITIAFDGNIEIEWNTVSIEKELLITCNENAQNSCSKLCQDNSNCTLPEEYCRDCAGNSIYLYDIFTNMGKKYRSTAQEISTLEFITFIASNNWHAMNSKSVLNFTDSFNSASTRYKFQSLCNFEDPNPIVFFALDPDSNELAEIKYVKCKKTSDNNQTKIFKMTNRPEMITRELTSKQSQ